MTDPIPEHLNEAPPPSTVPTAGQERLLQDITDVLRSQAFRLLTLVGPGGAGKTQLALHVAARLRHTFRGRVAFIGLEHVGDASDVVPAISQQIGLRPSIPPRAALTGLWRALCKQHVLLILDTFEHVTTAATDISQLLKQCPSLTILATSRRPLHLQVERTLRVPPLAVPAGGSTTTIDAVATSEAGAVFLDSKNAVAPEVALRDEQAPAIASICDRLDGSPLAMRLAAWHVPLLPPEDILRRLDNPLDFLCTDAADLPVRQRSLRTSVDWSYNLLTWDEQRCFRGLAVFTDSFPLAAAVAVIREDADVDNTNALSRLRSLIAHSLIQIVDTIDTSDATEPRYRLGIGERAFALELLDHAGELTSATRRLVSWVLALAEQSTSTRSHADDQQWLSCVAADAGIIAVARGWILATRSWRDGLRLATALYDYWLNRGCSDDEVAWLQALLEIVPLKVPRDFALRKATVMHLLGILSHTIGAFDEAEAAYQSALGIRRHNGDRPGEIATLHNMGVLSTSRGDLDRATVLFREASEEARMIGDDEARAMSLCYLAFVLNELGMRQVAWDTLQDAGGILRNHGTVRLLAFHASCLGEVLSSMGLRRQAREQWQRSLERSVRVGDVHSQAATSLKLADLCCDERRTAEAATHCLHALVCLAIHHDRRQEAEALLTCGKMASGISEWSTAVRLIGAGDATLDSLGVAPLPHHRDKRNRILRSVRRAIGARAAMAATDVGRSTRIDDAIAEAKAMVSNLADPASPLADTARDSVALTPRERDVLELLVRGLTNREMGDELGLSHRTVATHVTNLLGKLEVTTRAAAAGEAVRLGLVTSTTR